MHEHHFWKHFQHDSRDERRDFGGRGGPFGGRGGRRGGFFGFGPGGPGGFDVGRGRKLSSGELQLVLDPLEAFLRGLVLFFAQPLALDFKLRNPPPYLVELDGGTGRLHTQL